MPGALVYDVGEGLRTGITTAKEDEQDVSKIYADINRFEAFTKGFLVENPLLVLSIGLCSSLGVTTSIFNGFGMGVSMTFVLLMSEIVISLFKKLIPSAIRLPVFIIIIAAFTTIVQMVLQAYVPALYSALGVFLPLIVVNCIIMGRVEAFASKNSISDSILDALGMGIGYTLVMVAISLIRELFGAGTIMAGTALKVEVIPEAYRIGLFNSAPGGFLVFGIIAAIVQFFKNKKATKLLKEENEKQLAEQKKAEEEIAAKLEKIAKAKAEVAAKKAAAEVAATKAEETSKSENSSKAESPKEAE